MQHNKIICLDIETVPDRTLIPEWDDGKVAPKPICHQIVGISFVEARINYDEGLPDKVRRARPTPMFVPYGSMVA